MYECKIHTHVPVHETDTREGLEAATYKSYIVTPQVVPKSVQGYKQLTL